MELSFCMVKGMEDCTADAGQPDGIHLFVRAGVYIAEERCVKGSQT